MAKRKQFNRKAQATSSKGRSRNSNVKADDAGVAQHEERGGSRDNDVVWYAANEFLLRDAARLPFANPAGFAQTFTASNAVNEFGSLSYLDYNISVPAVCAIQLAPTFGPDTGSTSPLNVAARNLFGFIRSKQTVSASYNQATAMMYILSMTGAYSFYAFCARAYGLIRTYEQRNRAIPLAIFAAMNLDYNDLHTEMANFRYWLNAFADRVGALCIPSEMSYTKRQMWLYQNVFKDGLNDKSQVYVYTPLAFVKYNPIGHVSGNLRTPCLDYVSMESDTPLTFADLQRIGNELIEPLFQNNVINTISGDIEKSFGLDKVWQLLPIVEDYRVEPVLELNVLDQIHNMYSPEFILFGRDTGNHTAMTDVLYEEIDADQAIAYCVPNYRVGGTTSSSGQNARRLFGYNQVVIDFDRQEIQPADVMVATRLTATPFGPTPKSGSLVVPPSKSILCGSEVVTGLTIWAAVEGNTGWKSTTVHQLVVNAGTPLYETAMRAFYKHPITYLLDTQAPRVLTLGSDIENWTILDTKDLYDLHETALLSEFHVPLMGKLIK